MGQSAGVDTRATAGLVTGGTGGDARERWSGAGEKQRQEQLRIPSLRYGMTLLQA